MNTRPRLREDILRREVEDELLLYDPLNGETLLCNVTAASVVDLCNGARDAEAIARVLVSLVENADHEVVLADVEKAIAELSTKGMLQAE